MPALGLLAFLPLPSVPCVLGAAGPRPCGGRASAWISLGAVVQAGMGRTPLCLHPTPIPLWPCAQGIPLLSSSDPWVGGRSPRQSPSAFSASPGSPLCYLFLGWSPPRPMTWCRQAPCHFTPIPRTLCPSIHKFPATLPVGFAAATFLSGALTADPALCEVTAQGPPPQVVSSEPAPLAR